MVCATRSIRASAEVPTPPVAALRGNAQPASSTPAQTRSTSQIINIEIHGLHMEECETMGDTLGGIAVRIGSRVAALAQAGEVSTFRVKDLVVGSGVVFPGSRRSPAQGHAGRMETI